MRSLRFELGAVGLLEPSHVASVFDGGALHAEANSEEGNFVFAGVLNGVDHSLNAALAESAGDKDTVVTAQTCRGGLGGINFFGFDPLEDSFVLMGQAAVKQSFAQTFVGVFELNIFSDHGDAHFAGGMMHAVDEIEPRLHVSGLFGEFQVANNFGVESFFAELDGYGVNRVDIFHGDYAGAGDVAEERDFLFQIFGDVAVAAAEKNVGLNSDAQHFFDAVLRGLGF